MLTNICLVDMEFWGVIMSAPSLPPPVKLSDSLRCAAAHLDGSLRLLVAATVTRSPRLSASPMLEPAPFDIAGCGPQVRCPRLRTRRADRVAPVCVRLRRVRLRRCLDERIARGCPEDSPTRAGLGPRCLAAAREACRLPSSPGSCGGIAPTLANLLSELAAQVGTGYSPHACASPPGGWHCRHWVAVPSSL